MSRRASFSARPKREPSRWQVVRAESGCSKREAKEAVYGPRKPKRLAPPRYRRKNR